MKEHSKGRLSARTRRALAGLLGAVGLVGAGFAVWHGLSRGGDEAASLTSGGGVIGGGSLYQLDSVWTTQEGKPLRLAELRGRPRVLSMIFTRCPSACPTLVKEMQALERKLPEDVRERTGFVLVSIDPDHDTPQVLRDYAHKMGISTARWTLVRGSAEDVRELSATLGFSYGKGEGADIAHSKLITVLNSGGEIVHQQMGVVNDPARLVAAVGAAERPPAGG